MSSDAVRIFVGADVGERLPYRVLEHSIRRHTSRKVQMRTVDNSLAPSPGDARFLPYTSFSYGRFAIPKLAGYQGRALYLDSDMIVLRDVAELWEIPFDGAKVLIEAVRNGSSDLQRRTAVLLLDCENLPWDPDRIIERLGVDYDYEELMSLRPLLEDGELQDRIPYGWNSLDERDEHTRLLHYTRIKTQPWVYPGHPLGHVWIDEAKGMLESGALDAELVREEVDQGHVRPSLLIELGLAEPGAGRTPKQLARHDEEAGYVIHSERIASIQRRKRARLVREEAEDPRGFRRRRLRRRLRRFLSHPIRFISDPSRRL